MRVAHVVVSDHFAGVERYIATVAAEQSRRGVEVTVVGGEAGAMVQPAQDGPRWLPARTVSDAVRALMQLRRLDVIHAHMTAAEAAALVALTRHPRGRLVATRHFAQPRGSTLSGRTFARLMQRVPHQEIAVSSFVQTRIGVPCLVLPAGVPEEAERPPPGVPSVLVMQRHAPDKQSDVALRAWALSGLQERGWVLRMAGRGPDTAALRAVADELRIPPSSFVGFVPDVGRLLDAASVLLATGPADSFGLSLVEAMARGVPVVAADGGAHRETVGDAGRLFPPGDADAAAQHLRFMADYPAVARDLGLRGQARQRERFELTDHVDALLGVYRGGRS